MAFSDRSTVFKCVFGIVSRLPNRFLYCICLSVFVANLVALTSFSDSRENRKHDSFINFIKIALGQFFVQDIQLLSLKECVQHSSENLQSFCVLWLSGLTAATTQQPD